MANRNKFSDEIEILGLSSWKRKMMALDKKMDKLAKRKKSHNCSDNAVPYKSTGRLGHGWKCGICGEFLQARVKNL